VLWGPARQPFITSLCPAHPPLPFLSLRTQALSPSTLNCTFVIRQIPEDHHTPRRRSISNYPIPSHHVLRHTTTTTQFPASPLAAELCLAALLAQPSHPHSSPRSQREPSHHIFAESIFVASRTASPPVVDTTTTPSQQAHSQPLFNQKQQHAPHQKHASREAGQDRAFSRREPGEVRSIDTRFHYQYSN